MFPVGYRQIKRVVDTSTGHNFMLLLKQKKSFVFDKRPNREFAVNMLCHGSWDVWGYGSTAKDAYKMACSIVRFQQKLYRATFTD